MCTQQQFAFFKYKRFLAFLTVQENMHFAQFSTHILTLTLSHTKLLYLFRQKCHILTRI